jgi:two-component system, OmpR family, sensor histidine kinase ArlS
MKIRTKIALQFTLIVATILAIFSLSIYYLSENYRKQEFYKGLKDRAITTARLLIKEKEIDKKLLKIIDRNTLTTLYASQVDVFNDENKVAYSNYDAEKIYYSPDLLKQVRAERYVETIVNEKQVVGTMFDDVEGKTYVIIAQADDVYGKEKLENIKDTMVIGFMTAVFLTIIFGFIFAGQSLKPIARINSEVSKITAYNLTKKLSTGNNKDEIAQLARNFNEMLSRIEKSFELQKSFVSNASHELRTPLAAVKSEIQIALEKVRTQEEYKNILKSLLVDNQRLISLTNGLLQLAKSEKSNGDFQMNFVRIDEILFEVQEEILNHHPEYKVVIDFDEIPEDENWVTVNGNNSLLKTVFSNLFDNACKYSNNHEADVKIKFNKRNCLISVSDAGIGIPKEEIEKIFEPFYRTKNAAQHKGYGIGLSICKRIVDTHNGRIVVKSEVGIGSTFVVILPHN